MDEQSVILWKVLESLEILHAKTDAVQHEVHELRGETAFLREEVGHLRRDVDKLCVDVDELCGDMIRLNEEMSGLRREVGQLHQKWEHGFSEMSGRQRSYEKRLKTVEEDLAILEEKVERMAG